MFILVVINYKIHQIPKYSLDQSSNVKKALYSRSTGKRKAVFIENNVKKIRATGSITPSLPQNVNRFVILG